MKWLIREMTIAFQGHFCAGHKTRPGQLLRTLGLGVTLLAVATGCTLSSFKQYSSHDLDRSDGVFTDGGYRNQYVSPGVYRITALTNSADAAFVSSAPVRQMWMDQAVESCEGNNFIVFT